MNCYPYKIDGVVHQFKSSLGGFIQGDVENRYDAPSKHAKTGYAVYQDLYPNFIGEVINPKISQVIPPPSMFGIAPGLELGEYKYTRGMYMKK